MSKELTPFKFNEIELTESVEINGRPHFTRRAIGEWLEYSDTNQAIAKIIERNEYIREFSRVVNLTTVQNTGKDTFYEREIETEVYDPIGFQLIVMESQQPKARQYKVAVAHLVAAYASGDVKPAQPKSALPPTGELETLVKLFGQERAFDVVAHLLGIPRQSTSDTFNGLRNRGGNPYNYLKEKDMTEEEIRIISKENPDRQERNAKIREMYERGFSRGSLSRAAGMTYGALTTALKSFQSLVI